MGANLAKPSDPPDTDDSKVSFYFMKSKRLISMCYTSCNYRNYFGRFKASQLDGTWNKLNDGTLELKDLSLVYSYFFQSMCLSYHWSLAGFRWFAAGRNFILFEANKSCTSGPGVFLFRCKRANKLFLDIKKRIESLQREGNYFKKINGFRDVSRDGFNCIRVDPLKVRWVKDSDSDKDEGIINSDESNLHLDSCSFQDYSSEDKRQGSKDSGFASGSSGVCPSRGAVIVNDGQIFISTSRLASSCKPGDCCICQQIKDSQRLSHQDNTWSSCDKLNSVSSSNTKKARNKRNSLSDRLRKLSDPTTCAKQEHQRLECSRNTTSMAIVDNPLIVTAVGVASLGGRYYHLVEPQPPPQTQSTSSQSITPPPLWPLLVPADPESIPDVSWEQYLVAAPALPPASGNTLNPNGGHPSPISALTDQVMIFSSAVS